LFRERKRKRILHSRQATEGEKLADDMENEPVLTRTKPQKIFSNTLAVLIGISALFGSIGVIIFVPVALIALTIASVVCLVRRKQKAHEQ